MQDTATNHPLVPIPRGVPMTRRPATVQRPYTGRASYRDRLPGYTSTVMPFKDQGEKGPNGFSLSKRDGPIILIMLCPDPDALAQAI